MELAHGLHRPSLQFFQTQRQRRQPELGLLYQIVKTHWASFKAETEEHGGLPSFVKDEIEGYLQCGILEHGFIRARCKDCGHEELVAFSCKGRGFCPSCIGRRMNDTAAHLVDTILPEVPIRQWVCSFSWRLRYVMGYDKKLTSEILSAFMNTVIQSVKRRAKRMLNLASLDSAETGAVLVIQRFDSALRLNVHGHSLVLDGVYVKQNGLPVFYPLPHPTEHDVNWVASTAWGRIEKILKKHGRLPDDDDAIDQLSDEQPVLAHCYSQSTHGNGALRLLTDATNTRASTSASPSTGKGIVAQYEGINVHADTVIDGRDRKRLERLVRYIARPPIAQDRLEVLRDGKIKYSMKRVWRDGTAAVVLSPHDFMKRLAAMVPPPYFNMTRFYGVLAPHSATRKDVVAKPELSNPPQMLLFNSEKETNTPDRKTPCRQSWSKLLARVFKIDVSVCPECNGQMKIIDAVTKNETIRAVLSGLAESRPRDGPTQTAQLTFF